MKKQAGPVAHEEPIFKLFVPEGLYPEERTHSGVVLEELKAMERTHVGVLMKWLMKYLPREGLHTGAGKELSWKGRRNIDNVL